MRVRLQLLVPKQITKVGVWIFLLERTFGRGGSISSKKKIITCSSAPKWVAMSRGSVVKKNYYMFQCSKMGSDEQRFDLSEEQLSEIFDVALSLVRKGGEMVCSAINREKKVEEKESAVDLVTETDGAVEKLLFDGLRQVDSDDNHNNNNNKLWFAFLQGKVPQPQVHRRGDDGRGGDGREDRVLHQRPDLDHRPHRWDHELCPQQPERVHLGGLHREPPPGHRHHLPALLRPDVHGHQGQGGAPQREDHKGILDWH